MLNAAGNPTGAVTYELQYDATDSSIVYTVSISIADSESGITTPVGPVGDDGVPIGYKVAVAPGPASARRTYAEVAVFSTVAGTFHTFNIYARDEYGNNVEGEGQSWQFSPRSPYVMPDAAEAFVSNVANMPGLYRAKWRSNVAGEYVISVFLDGQVILSSEGGTNEGFVITVLSSTTTYAAWSVEGLGADLSATTDSPPVVLNEPYTFSIQPRDEFGNPVQGSQADAENLLIDMTLVSGTDVNPKETDVVPTVAFNPVSALTFFSKQSCSVTYMS